MSGKIVFTGSDGSGITCYAYGMLQTLMVGVDGFFLSVPDREEYRKVRKTLEQLGNTQLPLEQRLSARFPQRLNVEVCYGYEPVGSLEWIKSTSVSCGQLKNADSIVICVDGSVLQCDAAYETLEEELVAIGNIHNGKSYADAAMQKVMEAGKKHYAEWGEALCRTMEETEMLGGELPPVCLLITRYDTVPNALRNEELMERFLREALADLFCAGEGASRRVVAVCPAHLGRGLSAGGKLKPRNLEYPVMLAAWAALRNTEGRDTVVQALAEKLQLLPVYSNGQRSKL